MQSISESLKRQREQILEDGSEDALGRHTSLLEIAVISLHNRMVNRLGLDSEQYRSSGAVVALGAFGRGLVGPSQPIPILFLRTESSPWQESWLEEISTPLLNAGWNVSIQQASAQSLINKAHEDFPFFLDLLQARYISGSRSLVDQFDKALESFLEGRQNEFLHKLYDSVVERRLAADSPRYWLEPDLAQNTGGLSDIVAIRAACRICSNIRNLEDAIFRGYLLRDEVDFLQQAEKTYVRLLNYLYALREGGPGTLDFEEQESLALKLGYTATAGFLPVEAFMQRLQQFLHGVCRTAQEFWERLQEGLWDEDAKDGAAASELESGVMVRAGRLMVQPDRYSATAGNMIHLFFLASKHQLRFSNTTRQWIQHHHKTLDTAAGDATVWGELQKLLRCETPELPLVRQLYDRGLLTSLIPELSSVHCLVQHDAFHVYPVHEHHLRTLTEIKLLLSGGYADTEPELTQIAKKVDDITPLLLAGMLHDIGKSAGRDHAVRGGEMVPNIARRLGLHPEESDLVQFLVTQHLLLIDSAAMRDLADEEMLARCALTVETPERLDLLMLLSFADMAATGPSAQQKQKDAPVLQLYERVRDLLEKGEPSPQAISERIDHIRALVAQQVADLVSAEELEKHFSELAPRYLLSTPPGSIARHLRFEWTLSHSDEPFVCEVSASENSAEMTLMSWDVPELVSQTTGILSLHDMNISGAQIYVKENGIALLIFQCKLPEGPVDWQAIKNDMMRLRQGKLALDYRIALHAAGRSLFRQPVRPTPSRILVDNDASARYTILEVYTIDRIGLLYTIARTLMDLHARIFVAKITTKVDQAADVFYIKTLQGEKVTDSEQIEEIKCALQFWLDCSNA